LVKLQNTASKTGVTFAGYNIAIILFSCTNYHHLRQTTNDNHHHQLATSAAKTLLLVTTMEIDLQTYRTWMSLIGSTCVPIFCKRPVINSKGITKKITFKSVIIAVSFRADVFGYQHTKQTATHAIQEKLFGEFRFKFNWHLFGLASWTTVQKKGNANKEVTRKTIN